MVRPGGRASCGGATTTPSMPVPRSTGCSRSSRRARCPVARRGAGTGDAGTGCARLREVPDVDVLQHGYAHVNHAAAGEKKMELGLHRPASDGAGRNRGPAGWRSKRCSAPGRWPSWCRRGNRIAPPLVPHCRRSASRDYRPSGRAPPAPVTRGLLEINTHVDLIDWKGERGFVGETAADALRRH